MSGDTRGRCPNCAWAFWHARKLNLTPSERLVLFAIAERADEDLQCVPTQAMLAEDTGLSVRTLIPAIKSLAKRKDCIKVERRREGLHYVLLRPTPKPMTWPDVPEPVTDREVQNLHIAAQAEKVPECAEFAHPNAPEHAKSAHPDTQNLRLPLMKNPLSKKEKEERTSQEGGSACAPAPATPLKSNVVALNDQSAIVEAWNIVADDRGLPRVRAMPKHRSRALALRVKEVGVDGMMQAIENVRASAFCGGDNDRGWVADFDFLLQATSLVRVLEGRYADRPGRQRARAGSHAAFEQKLGLRPMQPSFDVEPDAGQRRINP